MGVTVWGVVGLVGGCMTNTALISKGEPVAKNIGIVYSGMGPDYRWV